MVAAHCYEKDYPGLGLRIFSTFEAETPIHAADSDSERTACPLPPRCRGNIRQGYHEDRRDCERRRGDARRKIGTAA